jgi:NitT/TauT family transport system permease protein
VTRFRLLRIIGPPLIPLLVLTAGSELLIRGGIIPGFILPAPSAVVAAVALNTRELLAALGRTALAASLGFLLSVAVGLCAAIALSTSRLVERALYPYTVFFQTVPIIAIAPLLVIWLNYGLKVVVASSFIVSVFPVIANALAGIRSTDPALLDLFRLYGASRSSTLLKLRIPAALPSILTGLRIAGGLAVIGAIVGEFITGYGLGDVIESAKTQQRVDLVFAAVLLASLLGLALFGLINLLSYLALRRWHACEQNG